MIELVVSRALSLGTPSPRLDQLHHSRSNPYPSTKQQVACQTGIPSMRHNNVNNNVVLQCVIIGIKWQTAQLSAKYEGDMAEFNLETRH